jgi:hypothetical protein
MKFAVIFLTGAALAQEAIVFLNNRPPQQVSPRPGECTHLDGKIAPRALTTQDIGLKFYTGYDCDGEQVATSTGSKLKPTRKFFTAKSVKTVSRQELDNEEASYYIYWGRY